MEEATKRRGLSTRAKRSGRSQAGQAMVEYLLIMAVTIGFASFIYFNKDYGVKGLLDKMILRLGSYLEKDLRAAVGTQQGHDSTHPFGGPGQWTN